MGAKEEGGEARQSPKRRFLDAAPTPPIPARFSLQARSPPGPPAATETGLPPAVSGESGSATIFPQWVQTLNKFRGYFHPKEGSFVPK